MESSKVRYVPAAGFDFLAPLYDPLARITTRELSSVVFSRTAGSRGRSQSEGLFHRIGSAMKQKRLGRGGHFDVPNGIRSGAIRFLQEQLEGSSGSAEQPQ